MKVLEISGLSKQYAGFTLSDVSFALEQGTITGFIGRNGAGKTTTLKSLLNFVHPDSGTVHFFGQAFGAHELEIKQRIGFVSGGADFYMQKKLRTITAVTRRMYAAWDEEAYLAYMERFALDERKTPAMLSAGMRVKYALTLALSHNADLLLLDEPTSGLDPISRDELTDIFLLLAERGKTILFSTHITADLEKCADNIVYIKEGKIMADMSLEAFLAAYKVVEVTAEQRGDVRLIGCKRSKHGYTALLPAEAETDLPVKPATLDTIMVHLDSEKGEADEKLSI